MQIYQTAEEDEYSQLYLNESSVLKIQNLQIALERAIHDISSLQRNLAFVIQIKQQLERQVQVRDKKEEMMMKEYERELVRKNNEIESLRLRQVELGQLLDDTKDAMNNREVAVLQLQEQKKRYERILNDQKYTIGMLQQQLLATKYSQDLSYQSINLDNIKIQQLQKENDKLTIQLTRLKSQYEKEHTFNKKQEKTIQEFKSWLGNVLGIKKVVEGCEFMLMEEISCRINNNVMRF